jgi:hypothetical protein
VSLIQRYQTDYSRWNEWTLDDPASKVSDSEPSYIRCRRALAVSQGLPSARKFKSSGVGAWD